MILPDRLKKGDIIGVIAPSNPIVGDNIEELENARKNLEKDGFKIKYSKNLFSNTNNYSASAKEKIEALGGTAEVI